MTVVKYLKSWVIRDYILHGSPQDLDHIKPKQGHSLSGVEEENRFGVYATEIPLKAVFHALVDRKKFKPGTFVCGTEHGIEKKHEILYTKGPENSNTVFYATQNILDSLEPGYVYVLEPTGFEAIGNGDFFSENEAEIVKKVPVLPKDYTGKIACVKL